MAGRPRGGRAYSPAQIETIDTMLRTGEAVSLADIARKTGVGHPIQAARMLAYSGFYVRLALFPLSEREREIAAAAIDRQEEIEQAARETSRFAEEAIKC